MKRPVSIAYAHVTLVLSTMLIACPPSRVAPVAARVQPTRYERIVLGFTDRGDVVFLEVRDRGEPCIRAHRIGTDEEQLLTNLEPTVAQMVTAEGTRRATVIAALRASSVGARLETMGFAWSEPGDAPVRTEVGVVTRNGEHIMAAADEATRVELTTLGTSVLPQSDLWLTSADGRYIAVELSYRGLPAVRDVRAFETSRIDAQLILMRADQALHRGADDEAQDAMTRARSLIAAGDPLLGALDYMQAGLDAKHGDASACVFALSHAIAHDSRYREQAQRDDAFDPVRKAPEFVSLLATSR